MIFCELTSIDKLHDWTLTNMTDDRGCIVIILVSCRECKLTFNTFLVRTDVITIEIFIDINHSANSGTLLVNTWIKNLISRSKIVSFGIHMAHMIWSPMGRIVKKCKIVQVLTNSDHLSVYKLPGLQMNLSMWECTNYCCMLPQICYWHYRLLKLKHRKLIKILHWL